VGEDAVAPVGTVTFEPCDPRVPAAPMPSDADLLELFSMAELALAAAVEDGTSLVYRCVYAPGATLEFRDDEPIDLERFINGLIADGSLFVEPPPLAVVRLGETESSVDLALIYPGDGFLPPIARFELIDGNWLYASTLSGRLCEYFPSEVLELLHPGTCR